MENKEQAFKVISGSPMNRAQRRALDRSLPFYSAELLHQRTLEPKPFDFHSIKEIIYRKLMRHLDKVGAVKHADGLFYLDTREPHIVTDVTAVTMAATAKAIYPAAAFPVLGGQYFNRPGKAIRICLWCKIIVAGTPGNFSFNVHWGTGADANGTLICVAGTPVALSASVTKCLYAEFTIRCLTTGTAGTLQATGWAVVDPLLIAATLNPILIPTAGAAASAALDLTAANIVSVQALQSGTAGSIQCQQLQVIALN